MLRLRKVLQEDCDLLFTWANDPQVRQNSIHTEPILWDTHVAWFADKLADSNCLHLIAEDADGLPVGQIRFDISTVLTECTDRESLKAEISLSMDRNQRGKGRGTAIIAQGLTVLFHKTNVLCAHAWIHPQNEPSQRAFLRAGFSYTEIETKEGQALHHYTRFKFS